MPIPAFMADLPALLAPLNFPPCRFYYINALAIIDNVSMVYKRLSHAAMRAGRNPEDIRLVAVSKTVEAERLREAVETGQRIFGESRVQEAAEKIAELAGLNIEWHMIGHLQKNKAKKAVELFEMIQSVDSLELMSLLNGYAAASGKVQRALIEVNMAGEASKHGVPEAEVDALLKKAEGMNNLRIEGLMGIPPYFEDSEGSRPYYKKLRGLSERYKLRELSMGMTHDFEVAIEEGATMVRVGTAIFGERPRRPEVLK